MVNLLELFCKKILLAINGFTILTHQLISYFHLMENGRKRCLLQNLNAFYNLMWSNFETIKIIKVKINPIS